MNINTYWYSILLALTFSFFSCGNEQNPQEKKEKFFFSPPVTTVVSHPMVILSDTCPKPNIIVIPTKNNTIYSAKTKKGYETIKLSPPITVHLNGGEAGGFTFMQNFNTEQGLALSSISCGFRDKTGNLWFGTFGGGISKYDGKSFTNYTTAQGLAHNSVRCITEDKTGNIWFATSGGLSRYNGMFFTNFTTTQGLSNNNVRSVISDKAGNVWFGTNGGGVCKYDGKKFTNFTTAHGLANNNVFSILEDKSGNIWLGTYEGISKYDPPLILREDSKTFINYTTAQGLAANNIWSISEDKIGNLWFATDGGGVSKYDGKAFTNYSTDSGLICNFVHSTCIDKIGNMWFGTSRGISRYDGKSFTNFTTTQGLANNSVWSITEDQTGHLWFGTNGGGINCYYGKSLTSYTRAHGLADNVVLGINGERSGNLLFATYGGITKYNHKSFTNFTPAQGLANNICCSFEAKNGNVWFGAAEGVFKYDGKSFTRYTKAQGLASNLVLSIIEDEIGNIWFGTSGGGVSRYDGKSFTNYNTAHGLVNNTIKCITKDRTGNMWFGTNGGASKYDGKKFTNYTMAQGLPNNAIYCIIEDKNLNLWFGTDGGGVSKFDPSAKLRTGSGFFTNYSTTQGLANDVVYASVQDTLNNIIWFGTNSGLSGLKLNSLTADIPEFENFNNVTGYPIKDFNANSLFIDNKGIIWGGTGDKLIRFDYNGVQRNPKPLDIFIQSIKINNSTICWNDLAKKPENKFLEKENNRIKSDEPNNDSEIYYDSLSLPPNVTEEINIFGRALTEEQRDTMYQKFSDIKFDSITRFYFLPQNLVLPFIHNNVTFDFIAIEPAKPYLVTYQYILDGYDKEWSPLTNKTSATFGNIHEGTYTFRLKAKSPDGIWSNPISYTFKVLPPLYRTWWAYIIYLIATSGFLYSLYHWRTKSLRRDKEILEQTVKERTSEVVEQKNIVEQKNKIVEEQKMMVEKRNEVITDSIEYAQNIQHAILPSEEEIRKYFKNYFILYKPKDIVSGDFYWLHEKGDTILFAVADCTGHGVPGAFMSVMGHNLLNDVVKMKGKNTPSEILDELNLKILKTLRQNNPKTTAKYGMDIELISLDEKRQCVEFSGAHNPLLIFRKKECIELKADKISVGRLKKEDQPGFNNQTFQLLKDDMLYMFSDGYVDQFGGPENKKFFSRAFRELLQTICELEMEEQKQKLDEIIINWQGNQNQTDDILVVGIRV